MRQITIFMIRNNIHEMKLWRIRIGIYLWPEYQQIDLWQIYWWRIYSWPIRKLFVNIELFAEHWYKNIREKKKIMCHNEQGVIWISCTLYNKISPILQTLPLNMSIYSPELSYSNEKKKKRLLPKKRKFIPVIFPIQHQKVKWDSDVGWNKSYRKSEKY